MLSESTSSISTSKKKTGPVKGRKRGKYSKIDEGARRRIIEAYDLRADWKLVAKNNGVKLKSAKGIIKSGSVCPKPRGGMRRQKILEEHEEFLLNILAENPGATLKSLKDELLAVFHLRVSATAIANHLRSKLTTVKKSKNNLSEIRR